MYGIAPIFAHPDFRSWLQTDIQPPKIEVRFTPNSRRSRDLGWTSGFDPKRTLSGFRLGCLEG